MERSRWLTDARYSSDVEPAGCDDEWGLQSPRQLPVLWGRGHTCQWIYMGHMAFEIFVDV